MRLAIAVLMFVDAAVFIFGALLHSGVEIGAFYEPQITPAAIVESVCALALIWGDAMVLRGSPAAARAALIGNLVAIAGVAIGMAALALGAGPRTASNDIYHVIMLVLATAALAILAARACATGF